MKYILIFFFYLNFSSLLSAQTTQKEEWENIDILEKTERERIRSEYGTQKKPNPKLVALLGIVPGLGHIYLGDYKTASIQVLSFGSLFQVGSHFASRKDYIESDQREVKFDLKDATWGYLMQREGFVYNDLPLFSETRFERDLRLLKEGKLAEVNTYLKYGTYTRSSRSTELADAMGNPILSTMLYSIYSSYRDAGGLGEYKKQETFNDIAFAPFNYQVLKNPFVFAPILLIGISLGLGNAQYDGSEPVLIQKSAKRDGTLVATSFINGISPAIGEEAFFRGYLNYNWCMAYGPFVGVGVSGTLFMLAHEGNPDAREGRVARLIGGLYLGLLHVLAGYDIRPGVALHFWYNFLIGLAQIQRYKADSNFNKSQQEVFYMPLQYTLSF